MSLNCVRWCQIFWDFHVEVALCDPAVTWDFEVASRFLETSCVPGLYPVIDPRLPDNIGPR